MSTDNTRKNLSEPLPSLGFEAGKEVYDVEHELTFDDLIASLRSNKSNPDKQRWVELRVPIHQMAIEAELCILVGSLTQVYTPYGDGRYYGHAEWAIEGWIMMPEFDPSPNAPSIRCFFEGNGADSNALGSGSLQFINPPQL